jgi:DNA-binding transcriptional regulator LsrR (DeoR family)
VAGNDRSLAARAAWLSFIGGYTQEEIAQRLGLSRVKINRLIAEATEAGLVRVFVEGTAAECVALEDQIAAHWKLDFCSVSPTVDRGLLPLRTLAAAGAHYLHGVLERGEAKVIGVGHGRTLDEVVKYLPRVERPEVKFVSLLGSLTRHAAANPFDVIHRLSEVTGAECYFMPAPFFADSIADKKVLLGQKGIKDTFTLAKAAELYVVGIGEIGVHAHMLSTRTTTEKELREVKQAGAVGEVLGRFLDGQGRVVPAELNDRAVAIKLEDIKGKPVIAIAGGADKPPAIMAVLESRVISGLITDEDTAKAIVDRINAGAKPGDTKKSKQNRWRGESHV